MKFSSAIIFATALLASGANAAPSPCESSKPYVTAACTPATTPLQAPGGVDASIVCSHGEWMCGENSVMQCNWGQWHTYECTEGTRCVPNDWECVFDSEYDRIYELFNPSTTSVLQAAPTPAAPVLVAPEGPCVNGEFMCYLDSVIQCNIDHWVLWPCATGTKCMENDYECIPLSQWDATNELINGNRS